MIGRLNGLPPSGERGVDVPSVFISEEVTVANWVVTA